MYLEVPQDVCSDLWGSLELFGLRRVTFRLSESFLLHLGFLREIQCM